MLTSASFHPFALMVDPAAVFRAVQASSALGMLQARVFRPLEQFQGQSTLDADLAAYDAQVDAFSADIVGDDEPALDGGGFAQADFVCSRYDVYYVNYMSDLRLNPRPYTPYC